MIKVKIVGALGYGGVGMAELLVHHPEFELTTLVDREDVGKPLSALYPHLDGFCDLTVVSPEDAAAQADADMVVYSTPDGVGMTLAEADLKRGAKVIDYSGDFRFTTEDAYADYATRIGRNPVHAAPALLGRNAYGLAELHRDEIRNAEIVGNPGCFACSCILGLAPAVGNAIVEPSSLICDCKTGVSGAGKKAAPVFHYPARYEQMNAYKLSGHQHVCEIEHELSLLSNEEDIRITFTAQVVPTCRGILSTLYGTLTASLAEEDVIALYREFYDDAPFVRVYGSATPMGTMNVRCTNYCNLVVSVDQRTNRLRIVSHIDNLMKGQAGSALQNMNLMFNLPESAGLNRPGMYP